MGDPIDLKLVETEGDGFDISWTNDGDFEMTDNYDTAVLMSILGERRAKPYEIALPQYRRGWIGNALYENQDEDGSGAWLYSQSRLNTTTLNGVRDEVEKGLLWLMDGVIATQVNVGTQAKSGRVMINAKLLTDNREITNKSITL